MGGWWEGEAVQWKRGGDKRRLEWRTPRELVIGDFRHSRIFPTDFINLYVSFRTLTPSPKAGIIPGDKGHSSLRFIAAFPPLGNENCW